MTCERKECKSASQMKEHIEDKRGWIFVFVFEKQGTPPMASCSKGCIQDKDVDR